MSATSTEKSGKAAEKKHTEATSPYDVLAPAGALVIIGLLSRFFVASDWERDTFKLDNDGSVQTVAFGVAIAAMFIVGWGMKLADEGRPLAFQRMRDRTMVTLGMAGVFAYFNFGHLHFGGFVHVWDT